MALPVVKDVLECANFSSTVEPYIHQLQTLPYVLAESVASPATLKQIYLNTNPLLFSLSLAIALAPIFLVISEVNKNYSQVDRAWSIVPIIYNAHYSLYAHMAGLDTKRVDALAITTTIWGVSPPLLWHGAADAGLDQAHLQLLSERRLLHRK